ncbi:MAG: GNAT family N-acetyltransferase [Candidatus Uhrbacteria bacterium]
MQPTVLSFPARHNPLQNRGVAIATLTPESDPSFLLPLYEAAVAPYVLPKQDRPEFVALFRGESSVRIVATRQSTGAPLGFALAAPVHSFQELANALRFDRYVPNAREMVDAGDTWALIVSVGPSAPLQGIGRALANQALVAMVGSGARYVFVAVRSSELALASRLYESGFSRDGTSNDDRRILLSRTAAFTF